MSSHDDPDESERTFQLPQPGKGRRALTDPGAAPPAAAAPATAPAPDAAAHLPVPLASGINPLIVAANPLLNLIHPLRQMPAGVDVETLRLQLQQAIRTFEAEGRRARLATQTLAAARYALCTLLDETISSTPWGGGGVWAARSLLVTFHNEAFGGEKFFQIVAKFLEDPRTHLDSLELFYVCLALGFEGRFRIVPNGREQLDQLRQRLADTIKLQRGQPEPELSPQWRGVVDRRNPLVALVPLWVVGAVVGVLLVLLHLGFSLRLASASDPVFQQIHALQVSAAAPPPTPTPIARTGSDLPHLAVLLKADVDAGQLAVQEGNGRATVTIHGDGLFSSGSSEIRGEFLPLLARIGEALKTYPGTVLVTGHTDDQRIVSARFPSNWKLSLERANAVLRMLAAQAGAPERFRAAGRGETEPLVPNDSPEHRARNRRVDITITSAGAGT